MPENAVRHALSAALDPGSSAGLPQAGPAAADLAQAHGTLSEALGIETSLAERLVETVASASGLSAEALARTVVAGQSARPGEPGAAGAGAPSAAPTPLFRLVDTSTGDVVYLPTANPCEVVRAAGQATDVTPQVSVGDGSWADGLGFLSDLQAILRLDPESLDEVRLVVLANPLAALEGSGTWKVLLLDGDGRERATGTYLRHADEVSEVSVPDMLLRAVGLERRTLWVDGGAGPADVFRTAAVHPAAT